MPDDHPLTSGPSAPPRRPRGCLIVLGVLALAALLSLLSTFAIAWLLTARISNEALTQARAVAGRFQQALGFQPEVRVDGVVVVGALSPATEIVTSSTELLARHRWSHTWLGSTKQIELEAVFTAKAGFTLETPFRIGVDGRTGAIGADFPNLRLLSLEMGDPKILRDEDGLWNKLTPADRELAFVELRARAREKAESSDFLLRARREFEERVKALLQGRPTPPAGNLPPPAGQSPSPAP